MVERTGEKVICLRWCLRVEFKSTESIPTENGVKSPSPHPLPETSSPIPASEEPKENVCSCILIERRNGIMSSDMANSWME